MITQNMPHKLTLDAANPYLSTRLYHPIVGNLGTSITIRGLDFSLSPYARVRVLHTIAGLIPTNPMEYKDVPGRLS